MGRICYICTNSHSQEYDNMRLNGKPIIEIYKYSQSKYNESNLRYWHFQKHFENHLMRVNQNMYENLGKTLIKLIKQIQVILKDS